MKLASNLQLREAVLRRESTDSLDERLEGLNRTIALGWDTSANRDEWDLISRILSERDKEPAK